MNGSIAALEDCARRRHWMLMTLLSVAGKPIKGATLVAFMAAAMHKPLAVPAKGESVTTAVATLPLGSNVTLTVARPTGPPFSRHLAVSKATALRAAFAESESKC